MLRGTQIRLRALEPEDLEFLYRMENDFSVWEISNTQTPYSKWVLRQYLENAHQDIYEAKQLRLAVVSLDQERLVGLIDLFDFDFKNSRAGVGILLEESSRGQGLGAEVLALLIDYAFSHLQLHQLYANISISNEASTKLFTKFGFQKIGIKKDWNKINGQFVDEVLFQLINNS